MRSMETPNRAGGVPPRGDRFTGIHTDIRRARLGRTLERINSTLDSTGEILGNGRFVGPGHAGIYRHDDGRYYFSHHFYDAADGGAPSMALWHLVWIDGWPQIDAGRPVRFE